MTTIKEQLHAKNTKDVVSEMICHWFKGGINTSSRVTDKSFGGYTVGVLVQANYGNRLYH